LGIGTTPAALIAHGIETTIVEIDPVVHQYATKYFGLPTNHKAVIEDAVSYASELALTDEKYDYIVNDVFTGGAEPVDLFTFEFLQDLNTILKPGGVIAIVYTITSSHPQTSLTTIELRRRSPPPLSPHNRSNDQSRLPNLPHLPRIRRSISRKDRRRRARFHQHGDFLHKRGQRRDIP
jgi:hypothetical protein